MSTVQKDAGDGGSGSADEEKRLVRVLAPSVALTITSGAMLFSARQAAALPMFQDAAALTVFFSRLASTGALMEFVVNPIAGKVSDAYGRRLVMPVANFAIFWARLLLFFRPNRKFPLVLEQAVSIPLVTSFFTAYRAALGDCLDGPAYTRANATISMGAGVAIVTGPLVAKAIMNRSDPKYCYLVSVFLNAASLLHLTLNFQETLPEEKRRPLALGDMQPFGFVKLMRSRVLRNLMITTGMQSFTEGRNITDVLSIYLLDDLKWSWNQINNYVSAYGVSLILSGVTVKPLLKALGMITFTTFSNTCNIVNLLATALVPPFSFLSTTAAMWLGVAFGAFGGRKRDAVESLIMKIGEEEGHGNGYLAGATMNFRAVINIMGPLLFGSLYAWGSKRKRSHVVFLAGALTIMLAEASMRQLGAKELQLDEKGQPLKAKQTASSAAGSS